MIQYKTKEKDWRQQSSVLNQEPWFISVLILAAFPPWIRTRSLENGSRLNVAVEQTILGRPSGEIIMAGNASSRRSFVKFLPATPLLRQIAAHELYAQATTAMGIKSQQNVYSRLGVKTVINCRGTWTYLSGSLEFPEVRQAQLEASEYFVNMLELQRAVGRRLAELTGAESGIVTSGSAGAMAAATAACMAGTDDKLIWQLPDTTGMKHEVVMAGGRSAFDSAIRLTGAKLVLAHSPEELANAINENTAMIYTTDLGEKLQQEVAISKEHKVPLLLDDAAGIPPVENAKRYARMGFEMYCFSGCKGLRGPQ